MYYYLNTNDKKYRGIKDHLAILYNHSSMTLEEIRLLLDLSITDFDVLLNKCYKKGMLDTGFRQYDFNEPKYYRKYFNGNSYRFIVRKLLDGKDVYFTTCRSEGEARFIVSELKKVGWDKSKLPGIREKIK